MIHHHRPTDLEVPNNHIPHALQREAALVDLAVAPEPDDRLVAADGDLVPEGRHVDAPLYLDHVLALRRRVLREVVEARDRHHRPAVAARRAAVQRREAVCGVLAGCVRGFDDAGRGEEREEGGELHVGVVV